MGIVIERKWRCNACDELHDSESDAEGCCPPTVDEVFLCPVCGDIYEFHSDAVSCCETDPKQIQGDDGKRFPKAGEHMSTAEYLAAYCELNKVKT